MKQKSIVNYLPFLTVLFGILGMLLRWALYAFCLDEKWLLPVNHPLELGLWAVTAAVLSILALVCWKLDGSNKYRDNFKASPVAAVGSGLGGLGIFLTAALHEPLLTNYLGSVWKLLGFLSGPCLIAAGWRRFQGKRPFFLLHVAPCLFLVFHIINHYQIWSGNPQLQDYVIPLFANMAWMFFCFYAAAFDVGSGKRRMHLFTGLAGVYLCLVNLSQTEYLFLYFGGIAWMLTDLCTLHPKPKQEQPPKETASEA